MQDLVDGYLEFRCDGVPMSSESTFQIKVVDVLSRSQFIVCDEQLPKIWWRTYYANLTPCDAPFGRFIHMEMKRINRAR